MNKNPVTDLAIKKNVEKHLEWDSMVDIYDIDVDVKNGMVTLSGVVPFYSTKKSATAGVWDLDGVIGVKNKLKIVYPDYAGVPTDSEIKRSIKNLILWDSHVFSCDIEVDVVNREVHLDGSVDNLRRKIHAENLASQILGVQNIINNIKVTPEQNFTDEVIKSDILDALNRLIQEEAKNINIKVSDGRVMLSGFVSNWDAKRVAERAVRYTKGVKDVKSDLKIKNINVQ